MIPSELHQLREAIIAAVRRVAPIEDPMASARVTLVRDEFPLLGPALSMETLHQLSGALPVGWYVMDLTPAVLIISAEGRRA